MSVESRPIILILDDDEELNGLLKSYLTPFGWNILCSTRPDEALRLIESAKPTLIILDVMLPGKDGYTVCTEIRARNQIPIIMLTARGGVKDRIKGLQLGADDYLPKPFEPNELVARIQAVLRRIEAPRKTSVSKVGEISLDKSARQAFLAGKPLELTGMEFSVLELLMDGSGNVLSRDAIAMRTKGTEWEALDRTIDVVIGRLRGKLGDDPRKPRYIKTIWGEGYVLLGGNGSE